MAVQSSSRASRRMVSASAPSASTRASAAARTRSWLNGSRAGGAPSAVREDERGTALLPQRSAGRAPLVRIYSVYVHCRRMLPHPSDPPLRLRPSGDEVPVSPQTTPPEPRPGTVALVTSPSCFRLVLGGELDLLSKTELLDAVREALMHDAPVEVDTRAVTFMDSTVIA